MPEQTGTRVGAGAAGRGRMGLRFAVALVLLCFWPVFTLAGVQVYDGITVSVEPPAEASSHAGYAVYRMTVANRGKTPRTVTVTIPAESWSYGDNIERLSRTVRVEPNSTAVAELLQPALPMEGSDARVSIDGQSQRKLVPLSLTDHLVNYEGEPMLVSRGVGGAVSNGFDAAMGELLEEWEDEFGSFSYSDSDRPAHMARAERPVSEWSGNWLAYSRYMLVMLTEEELRDAPLPVDTALRNYVAAGGRLVVLGNGAQIPALGSAWTQAATETRQDPNGNQILTIGMGAVEIAAADKVAKFNGETWDNWINRVSGNARRFAYPLDASDAEYRLPMIESMNVPTRGLLALMLLFTLLIGPGNILLLSWLKRRMWMLWTIPTIAFVFAGAVLVYSIFNEGVRPRAKTVSITLLDQTTRQSVTFGMTGYYAPLTPGDGLHFGSQTMITAHTTSEYDYYSDNSGRARSMDVTNGQHLTRGWIVARVPAHFSLTTVESRRERLEISRESGGQLSVVNGLGLPIKRLYIADESNLYEVGALAPGDSSAASQIAWGGNQYDRVQDILRSRDLVDAARAIEDLGGKNLAGFTYLAILDNTGFVEPGLKNLGEHETTGIVVGRWEPAK